MPLRVLYACSIRVRIVISGNVNWGNSHQYTVERSHPVFILHGVVFITIHVFYNTTGKVYIHLSLTHSCIQVVFLHGSNTTHLNLSCLMFIELYICVYMQ